MRSRMETKRSIFSTVGEQVTTLVGLVVLLWGIEIADWLLFGNNLPQVFWYSTFVHSWAVGHFDCALFAWGLCAFAGEHAAISDAGLAGNAARAR